MAFKGQLVGIPKSRESVLRMRVNKLVTGVEQMKMRHIKEVYVRHERIVRLQEEYKKLNKRQSALLASGWEEEIALRRNITQLINGLDKMKDRHDRELAEQYEKIKAAEKDYEEFMAEQGEK